MARLAGSNTRVGKPDVLRVLELIRSNRLKTSKSQNSVTVRLVNQTGEIILVLPSAALEDLLQAVKANVNSLASKVSQVCERVNNPVISQKLARFQNEGDAASVRIHIAGVVAIAKPQIVIKDKQISFA